MANYLTLATDFLNFSKYDHWVGLNSSFADRYSELAMELDEILEVHDFTMVDLFKALALR